MYGSFVKTGAGDVMADTGKRACACCGDAGDVVETPEYAGGRGYVVLRQCRNLTACWDRQDRAAEIKAVAS